MKLLKQVHFSILVDESKDCSKMEQMSVSIRYVDDKATVQERFLTFVEAPLQDAASLSSFILDKLHENQLAILK